jgi:hypothetical protein
VHYAQVFVIFTYATVHSVHYAQVFVIFYIGCSTLCTLYSGVRYILHTLQYSLYTMLRCSLQVSASVVNITFFQIAPKLWHVRCKYCSTAFDVLIDDGAVNNIKLIYKKLKLSNYTPRRRLRGEEVRLLLILDLGTRLRWVVSVTPRQCFTPGERTPGNHWTRCWGTPELVWTQRIEEKSFRLCRGSNLDRQVVRPVARHCTHWATRLTKINIYKSII